MKKVLLLSVCLIVSVLFGGARLCAQSSSSVTFSASDDDKTLTISGQGDLTNLSFVDNTKKVFTQAGAEKVMTGQYYGPINEGDEYDSSKEYWYKEDSQSSSVKIENNETFFNEHSNLIKNPSYTFAAYLVNMVKGGSYTKVKFVKASSEELIIDANSVQAILYYGKENSTDVNTNIETLDLGGATIKELTSTLFYPNSNIQYGVNANYLTSIKYITLPLTKVEDGKMVLPEGVVGPFGSLETKIQAITVPEGYTALGEKAFYNASKIAIFNLPASLTSIGASAFENCSAVKAITLPNAVTYIGKSAFVGTNLTELTFPVNLDKVDDAAFFNVKIKNLKFNNKLRYIGNTAFGWNSNDNITLGTLNIPASVKYIGPAAFNFREYQDVYFHSTKAPLMPYGTSVNNNSLTGVECTAFSSHTLMGNNGFQPSKTEGTTMEDVTNTGYANRENYKNGSAYFVILHYPKTLTNESDIDTYTDYTRKYWATTDTWTSGSAANAKHTVGEETTELKGFNNTAAKEVTTGFKDTYVEGDYIWPSQTQWMRAYITAVNGVKWNGKDTYRTQLTEDELSILEEAGYKKGETADHDNGVYTLDELQKMAHQGTRMFVLANNDSQNGDDYPIDIQKGGKWWTLCVPFNMTKKQVKEVFGDETNVCLFNKVVRTVSPSKGNHISLYFTLDVCQKHKCELADKKADGTWDWDNFKDKDAPEDDDIVIQAHESYMIRPSKTDEDAVFVVKNYNPEIGNPIETVVTSQVEREVQDAADDTPEYRFIGNYLGKVHIPQYSYIYATKDKSTDKKYKFWFITDGGMVWSPNKSVVQTNVHGGGLDDYQNFFGGTSDAKGAMQSSVFGAEDGTTNIDSMTIIAGEGNDTPVYGVDGRMVSHSGDTTGLAKGIYIQNGKKFIVK